MLAGGCSNPFLSSYSGRRQAIDVTPERVQRPIEARRLGTSVFDVDMNAMGVPGDAQAKAAAQEVGAPAYYWKSEPKFHAGNVTNSFVDDSAVIGGTRISAQSYDEKLIKWYTYEAIFYADPPPTDSHE